jgi:hypothetical protein
MFGYRPWFGTTLLALTSYRTLTHDEILLLVTGK